MDMGDLFDKKGISMCISKWRKFSRLATPTQSKAGGNYLNSIIATGEAKSSGYDDAILLDHEGYVSEATGENIFIVKNGKISTPPESSSPLLGITRDTVKRMGKDLGVSVVERKISVSQLKSADEIFLSGTASEIIPVTRIDRKKISKGVSGPVTRAMMDEYGAIVNDQRPKYSRWPPFTYPSCQKYGIIVPARFCLPCGYDGCSDRQSLENLRHLEMHMEIPFLSNKSPMSITNTAVCVGDFFVKCSFIPLRPTK